MIDKTIFRKVRGIRRDRLSENLLVKNVQVLSNGGRAVCIKSAGSWAGLVALDEEGV